MSREGRESEEIKEFAQLTVALTDARLYPDWEVVGDPWEERGRKFVSIRKRIR
jgi:hypothetical protein